MSEEKRVSIRDAYTQFKKDPDNNQDKLIAVLNKYKNSWEQERKSYHDRIWRENLSFYSGNHEIRTFNRQRSQHKVKIKENHTNNTINRMLSIFVQNLPIVRVFPASSSDEDIVNAENTETYGKYFYRKAKLEQKFIKFIKYSLIFGNGFIYPYWNPDLGDKMDMGDDEQEGASGIVYYQGDIQLDIDDPFRILVRPGIEEMDDMYDFIRSVPANRGLLEFRHGEIEGEPLSVLNAYDNSIRSDADLVLQNHYYHKPTPWFPEGLYISWVNKKILKVRESSLSEKKLPLIHLPFDRVPLKFYGMSSIEQVIDLQEQLNRAASMIVEARNLVARPRVVVSNEAKVPGQSLTDRPGEIMRYAQAGGPPQFIVPNFQFGEMQAHKADLRQAIDSVMGITSASRGEVPAAVKTALGLQMVLEQDRSQYVPFIKNLYQCISDAFSQILGIAAENLDENDPRVLKIEGNTSSRTFHGGMVPSPLDIYLEDTNPFGWTAAGRVETIGNLIDKQIVTDRNQILEMLKINNTDPAYKYLNMHKNAATRENEELKKGIPLDIGPEDDDAIHLDEHTPVVAGFEFRSMPKAVQDAFLLHIEMHKNRIAPQPQPDQQPKPITRGGLNPEQAAQSLKTPVNITNMQDLLQK